MRRCAASVLQTSRHWAAPAAECPSSSPLNALACLFKTERGQALALPSDTSRCFSALPEYASDFQREDETAEHSRRLQEMEKANIRRPQLPSSEEVKQRLQSNSKASCSSSSSLAQQMEDSPILDWQEVVHRLRQQQQPAEQLQDQMLTDTFG